MFHLRIDTSIKHNSAIYHVQQANLMVQHDTHDSIFESDDALIHYYYPKRCCINNNIGNHSVCMVL